MSFQLRSALAGFVEKTLIIEGINANDGIGIKENSPPNSLLACVKNRSSINPVNNTLNILNFTKSFVLNSVRLIIKRYITEINQSIAIAATPKPKWLL